MRKRLILCATMAVVAFLFGCSSTEQQESRVEAQEEELSVEEVEIEVDDTAWLGSAYSKMLVIVELFSGEEISEDMLCGLHCIEQDLLQAVEYCMSRRERHENGSNVGAGIAEIRLLLGLQEAINSDVSEVFEVYPPGKPRSEVDEKLLMRLMDRLKSKQEDVARLLGEVLKRIEEARRRQ